VSGSGSVDEDRGRLNLSTPIQRQSGTEAVEQSCCRVSSSQKEPASPPLLPTIRGLCRPAKEYNTPSRAGLLSRSQTTGSLDSESLLRLPSETQRTHRVISPAELLLRGAKLISRASAVGIIFKPFEIFLSL